MIQALLAIAEVDTTVDNIEHGYKSLIVSGLIILAFIGFGIWWLKRNA